MTFNEFHSGLRALLNIDADEFLKAAYPDKPTEESHGTAAYIEARDARLRDWGAFQQNPHRWFIRVDDTKARAIWALIDDTLTPDTAKGDG